MVPHKWRNNLMLECAFAAFGLPCELHGDVGGTAEWRDGPLKASLTDEPLVILQVRGKANEALGPVQHSGGMLTVESNDLGDALAALALGKAIGAGLLSAQDAKDEDVMQQWREAAQTPRGAQRLLRLILYTLQPGPKSADGLEEFAKDLF